MSEGQVSSVLGKVTVRTAADLIDLNERVIALVADGKLKVGAGKVINGAIANCLRTPLATDEGGALAISDDYISIVEIVKRLTRLPLEMQDVVVKELLGGRIHESTGEDSSRIEPEPVHRTPRIQERKATEDNLPIPAESPS